MRGPGGVIAAFCVCLLVGLAAMGWLTMTVLRLDRSEETSRRQAEVEEGVRLALWRMDSALAPVLAQENARPYFMYNAYYPADRSYNRMFAQVEQGDVLIASPLLHAKVPHVLLHFQVGPEGEITSPQVPTIDESQRAQANPPPPAPGGSDIQRRLAELKSHLERQALLKLLPSDGQDQLVAEADANGNFVISNNGTIFENNQRNSKNPIMGKPRVSSKVQQDMNANEYEARNSFNKDYQAQAMAGQQASISQTRQPRPQSAPQRPNPPLQQIDAPQQQAMQGPMPLDIKEGMFTPMWLNGSLLLLRRIDIDGKAYVQGCWLDWTELDRWLVDQASDLLPNVKLEPAPPQPGSREGHFLAGLPVQLIPGDVPASVDATLSPLKLSLVIAWGCVVVAAIAVAVLMNGALTLSERRGTFVSAVTHELRTPLTTFRMYTQMLTDKMVPDPDKQAKYLNVLRVEADRLSHLVENVLAYARLEKGRAAGRIEDLSGPQLLQKVTERPKERAAQAEMEFIVDESGNDPSRKIRADTSAVEQIVFNLVDNACKYAQGGSASRITVALQMASPAHAMITVTDCGQGISAAGAKKLFRPFSKSAHDAAHSAPGVGLGLALSRRLARDLGGDLKLDQAYQGGARFILTLPIAA